MTRPIFALLIMLAAGVAALQAVHERNGGPPAVANADLLYVRSPEALQRLALSYDAVLADLYWIRAVQHYGGTKRSTDPDKQYDLLYPLLDLTTSLDPHFNIAYHFGSIFLAEPPPNGPGRTDLAIRLLEKGLRAQPDKWEFAQAIGFVHYWWRRDYDSAAEWFARAAKMPAAPVWMAPLAATTLAQGGRRESSRRLWEEIARTEEAEWFRAEANRRLRQLDAMDQIDRLRQVIAEFVRRDGAVPASWEQLRQAGLVRGTPLDPSGVPYRLEAGNVVLNTRSPLSPLPTETGQAR